MPETHNFEKWYKNNIAFCPQMIAFEFSHNSGDVTTIPNLQTEELVQSKKTLYWKHFINISELITLVHKGLNKNRHTFGF